LKKIIEYRAHWETFCNSSLDKNLICGGQNFTGQQLLDGLVADDVGARLQLSVFMRSLRIRDKKIKGLEGLNYTLFGLGKQWK